MLETIDLSARLQQEEFDAQKITLQNELRQAQLKAWKHKLGVIVVLEGWSFSGRVPCARFLSQPMDPRGLKVHMDGARFANAVVFLGCHPGDVTWRAGVDGAVPGTVSA